MKDKNFIGVKAIVLAMLLVLIIKTTVINTTIVYGESMFPTLDQDDRLFVNRLRVNFDRPRRGDIVVIHAPDNPSLDYVKRVVAVSGDHIEIKDGKVIINGRPLKENYIFGDYTEANEYAHQWILDEGEIFVLGDNRMHGASKDSRSFGPISEDAIKGYVIFRFYPIDHHFGPIE